ncbi:MAG: TetR/AcrR family transcriptional regulator [Gammaproteobacteria bacterium]|jgi:AcrR family transcriptional regulator
MNTNTRSNSSRERILACAQAVILQKGFSGTSIEDILEKASITKGGFFYHFDGKPGLAEALIDRYLEHDDLLFGNLLTQSAELSEDPLHRLLIFLKLLSETLGSMKQTHPGCLVASFTYESQQFRENIRDLVREGMLRWRKMIMDQLRQVDRQYATTSDISPETLADMFTAIIEGGIMLARNFDDNRLLVNQIMAYRSFIRVLYGAS